MIAKNIKSNLKRLTKGTDVEDILLFGSAARKKRKPNDYDILVLFKTKVQKDVEYSIRKELEKSITNVSMISKTEKTIVERSFVARESILFEARSLISGENLAERYGFSSSGMFKYYFKDWSKLKKTKFYHALNGRTGKTGVADALECIKLSDGLILAPLERIDELREFLELWDIEYTYIPILIPERLGKKHILERQKVVK